MESGELPRLPTHRAECRCSPRTKIKALCADLKARFLKWDRVARLFTNCRFTVTPATVVATFGSGPVPTVPTSTLKQRIHPLGWLWWDIVGKPAPPMDTSLVDSLKEQIEKGDVQLVRVTGPLGAGKSFATMQLACEEFVDFVDGGWLSGIGSHVFNELKLRIDERIGMKHALLLLRGESIADITEAQLSSRWEQYLVWVLMHVFAALRSWCDTPRDWLFLQRYHGNEVCQAYDVALTYAHQTELSYAELEEAVPDSPYAFVADRAMGALLPSLRRRQDELQGGVGLFVSRAGAGAATSREHQPRGGLLNGFMSALWAYNQTPLATIETAPLFVNTESTTSTQPVSTSPRCVHAIEPWRPFAPVSCLPYFTPAFCRKHVTFYMNLLRPNTASAEDIDDLCNELQGERVSFTTL